MPSYERDLPRFARVHTQVLGISVDSRASKAAWARELGGISYPLLADFCPPGEVCRRYGLLRPDCQAERALIVVDRRGIVSYIDVHARGERPDNELLFHVLELLHRLDDDGPPSLR